ncbi:YfjI family protein [Roseobacter weihaiensis]|uniref:YfjI family protein n=1 Tax=Roseobacter weihaiensis TaxID=2763262 RepID=UPI001D0B0908|nr:YfjI family protein [Roseobacter sp. H9]
MRSRPEGVPLPLAHLGPLRAPTQALADLTQAPVEIGAQSLLAVSSLATQSLADVETLAGKAPLSLFFLTFAPSGERKSSCDKLAMAPVQHWEEEQFTAYLHRRKTYEFDLEVFENRHRKQVKARSGGDGNVIETDAPQAPVAPIIPRKVLSDVTYEGLLHHFEDGDPSVGIFSDEGGQIFGGHAMCKENQLKTSAGLSKIWDGAPLNRTRADDALTTFRHRRGCLHLMLQTGVAESVFANDTFRDQGLLSRCLIAQPQSRIGQRFISEGPDEVQRRAAAKETLAAFHAMITGLLSQPPRTNGNPRELSPPTLELSPEARSMLVAFANEVEREQGKDGDLAHITGVASKAAEQAARIAGVFSVLADPTTRGVTAAVMLDAIRLMAWYLAEAQRALDVGRVDPSLQMAERLRVWLLEKMPHEPFDKRKIVRFGPASIRDTKTVEKLLNILERHHWIVRVPAAQISGKKAAQTWRVVSDV